MKKLLLDNLDKLHTTELGKERIIKNMSLEECDDVVLWCKDKILKKNTRVLKKGKNLYAYADECIITINASSFTIITIHNQFY